MGMTYKFPYKESPYIIVPAVWWHIAVVMTHKGWNHWCLPLGVWIEQRRFLFLTTRHFSCIFRGDHFAWRGQKHSPHRAKAISDSLVTPMPGLRRKGVIRGVWITRITPPRREDFAQNHARITVVVSRCRRVQPFRILTAPDFAWITVSLAGESHYPWHESHKRSRFRGTLLS